MPGYDLNTESINSFVDDSQIELPRFQRKLTWTDKDNFKLCLSVFKGYPLGVIVLSKDSDKKYLLDGRQRRFALDEMRNPEKVYDWARSAIGFNLSVSEDDLRTQYWRFVDQYFGEFEEDDDDDEDFSDSDIDTNEDSMDNDPDFSSYNQGEDENLIRLLSIILSVHPKRSKASGITKPFDFRDDVSGLDYIADPSSGYRYVDTDQLLDWIEYRSGGRKTPQIDNFTQDDLYNWLMSGKDPGEGGNATENKIRKEIDRNWDQIIRVFEALQALDSTLSNRKIGYMEVRDASANDEKKIFEIINSEGTDLTAVEILSAKPAYNIEIENPSEEIVSDIKRLYEKEMEVSRQEAVRWDRPATLYSRLEVPTLFPSEGYSFERKVRIGFKLMSGYFLNGISKEDFEALAKVEGVNWSSTELEQQFNQIENYISGHPLVSFWKSWDNPMVRMTSEAVAINYLLCMLKYWELLEKPTSTTSSPFQKFQNKGAVLFDKMIYEYVTRLWSGSSDTRTANNLKNLSVDSTLYTPIKSEDWESLLTDLIEEGQIEGQNQLNNQNPSSRVKLLLRYYYVLTQKRPTDVGEMSIDHIIPSKEFESSPDEDIKRYEHHIANLAEIPGRENSTKGSKTLEQISDPWLKSEIERFTGIESDNFGDYSDVTDIEDLIEDRGKVMIDQFLEGRRELLSVK
ncbi:DUF262 domain-containing protein [Haloferax sulfurifontis]|uniref:GmrSD restriction endonucleases N-terminal domain-containing protein n=1 Tax=Haloferax sulfurifontis ATCC BAA-897 TaxID=662480 RepID=M0I050_9EURY|nr:DUF262 domain-containing protein [Haloferax sulfurifontis]ELZ90081.1 hypothetical protein C441_14274 [Haloferax sulfurifontis ATCC BAA-897]